VESADIAITGRSKTNQGKKRIRFTLLVGKEVVLLLDEGKGLPEGGGGVWAGSAVYFYRRPLPGVGETS